MKPKRMRKITIEGFRPEEIVALPDDQVHEYVFRDGHVVFRVGEVEIRGEFRRETDRLVAMLLRISPGGETLIPSLAALLSRYARLRQIPWIEWEVHATGWTAPPEDLIHLLVQRGFTPTNAASPPAVYRYRQKVDA